MKGLSEDQQDSGEYSLRRDVHSQQFRKLCASVLAASMLMPHAHMTHMIASDLMLCHMVASQSCLHSYQTVCSCRVLQLVHVAKAYRVCWTLAWQTNYHNTFAFKVLTNCW